ncbi:MAG: hypothetical protein ABUL77_05490 [Bacteroidota bacterium]
MTGPAGGHGGAHAATRVTRATRAARRRALAVLLALTVGGAAGVGAGVVRADDAGPGPAFAPRLLIQSDLVVAHHGAHDPLTADPVTRPGPYLRRARPGGDGAVGPWRGRVVIEAASQPEIPPAGTVAATPPAATAGGVDPIAGMGDGGATARPVEAFVAFAPDKALAVSAGVLRVPLGLSRQIDEGDLRLPERARIVTRGTPDARAGVALRGDTGLLQYAFGTYAVTPRLGTPRLESSAAGAGTLYVGRLSAEPVGPLGIAPHLRRHDDPWYSWWRFSVGVSTFFAQLPGHNEWGLGGDGQFQWARLCVTGEVLWTRRAPLDRVGFTVEPGVFVVPDLLEVVARLEWFNDDVGPRSPLDAWGGSLGATVWSATRHARLQAAYTLRRAAAGGDPISGWAVLRATFTL